jgi:hypothetical protein
MFLLVLLQTLQASDGDSNSVDAPSANISQIKETLIIDFTNTIVYAITQLESVMLSEIQFGADQSPILTNHTSVTIVVTFIPTLLRIKKILSVTPAPTGWLEVPPPTQELRTVVFRPYYLCLCSFALLFLGGGLWTYRFKKRIRVLGPTGAFDGNRSDSDELDEVKSGRSDSGRSNSGRSNTGRRPTSARPKSTTKKGRA